MWNPVHFSFYYLFIFFIDRTDFGVSKYPLATTWCTEQMHPPLPWGQENTPLLYCLFVSEQLFVNIYMKINYRKLHLYCLFTECIIKYLIKSQVINCFLWCNGFSSWFAVYFVHVSFLKQSPSLQLDIRIQEHFRSCCLVDRKPGHKAQVSNPQFEQRAAV